MPELSQARVCHLSAGRLRLKIPERKRDEGYFADVARRLGSWDSVDRVEVNPVTGSVLVRFSDLAALAADHASRNELFALDPAALRMPAAEHLDNFSEQAARTFGAANRAVQRWMGGATDLRGAIFAALLAGGVMQLLRGNIAAPASTLLWYAGAMIRLWDPAPEPDTQPDSPAALVKEAAEA